MSDRRYYSDEDWPHGLRCHDCSRLFVEGDEIREELDSFVGDTPLVLIRCVLCEEKVLA